MKTTLAELNKFTKDFLDSIESFDSEKALLVTLSGNLGAGKTTFTQNIAEKLNIKEKITSPTFVLMKIYPINFGQFKNLVHIDAYRIENISEFAVLNFEEILNDSKNLILLEWPEKVSGVLPEKQIKISFDVLDEESREINIFRNV